MKPHFYFKDIYDKQESQQTLSHTNILKLRQPQLRKEGVQLTQGTQEVLLPSFSWLVLGKPGSGKTHFINQIIDQSNFYGKKFDRIIYIGPARFPSVIHDDYNTSTAFDMKFIEKRIAEAKKWAQNMLIIMDDVISQIPVNSKGRLQELFFNRRHILPYGTISLLLTSQKLTSVPTWIRSSLNAITVFGITKNEIKVLFNELPLISNMGAIKSQFQVLPKFGFVYFNLDHGKAFDHNFEPI